MCKANKRGLRIYLECFHIETHSMPMMLKIQKKYVLYKTNVRSIWQPCQRWPEADPLIGLCQKMLLFLFSLFGLPDGLTSIKIHAMYSDWLNLST
jgi:hypothetical protein